MGIPKKSREPPTPCCFSGAVPFSRAQIALVQRGFLSGRQPPFGFDRLVVTDTGEPLYRVVKTPGNELVKYDTAGNEIEKIPPIKKTNNHGQDILVAQPIPKARTQHVILVPSVDPLKVGTVRRIFETYDQNGVGLRYISNMLNQKGYPSPYGKAWRTSTVREILKNPACYGAIVFNRRCMGRPTRPTSTRPTAKEPLSNSPSPITSTRVAPT